MRTVVHIGLTALGLCAGFVVLATLLGLGVARHGPPMLVALTATILVLVPPLGLGALVGRRGGFGASLLLWSIATFVALPLYFPGERHDAMATGFAIAGALFGIEPGEALVARLDAMAPVPDARPVPAKAIEPAIPELPPSQATLPDQVALPYEGRRNTLLLPITVESKARRGNRDHELWMLFDTGATLTTLTEADLADIGVHVASDAPTVTMHTAAGDRNARLVLLDQIWIGGFPVDGVTVSVCDACADDKAAGLLGLDVSGQFLVTLDTVRHEVVLQPRTGHPDRTLDIQPWVDISGNATRWPDGRSEVEVSVENRADRKIEELVVHVACDRTFEARLVNVPPRGEASTTVSLPRDASCDRYALSLESASW
jgi:clan AA aspartic protease (TIGR02281 family)